jgi:hypothetical protein
MCGNTRNGKDVVIVMQEDMRTVANVVVNSLVAARKNQSRSGSTKLARGQEPVSKMDNKARAEELASLYANTKDEKILDEIDELGYTYWVLPGMGYILNLKGTDPCK